MNKLDSRVIQIGGMYAIFLREKFILFCLISWTSAVISSSNRSLGLTFNFIHIRNEYRNEYQ